MANLVTLKRIKAFLAPRKISFQDPDTGRKFIAKTRPELVQKIITYRAQNELEPIENLDLVLNNYWCSCPENKHLCEEITLQRGWMAYLKGGISLIKTIMYDKLVSIEEADSRAEICINCPFNVKPVKSNWESWADEIAEHAVGDRKSKFHEKLFNCEVCSCNLRAKVHCADVEEDNENLPDYCWSKLKK